MKKENTYEYILWSDCNNNCEFCWSKFKESSSTKLETHDAKRKAIVTLNNKIKEIPDKHTHVMVAGGELFYESNSYEYTDHLSVVLCNYISEGKIDAVSFITNLIYKDLESISDFILSLIEIKPDLVISLVTSYDITGRFETEEDRLTMLNNLDVITYSYPQVNAVVNMILTQDMCQSITSGVFNFRKFEEKYRCHINFIPYIILKDEFTPSREILFQALDILAEYYPPGDYIRQFDKLKRHVYKYEKNKGFSDCYSGDSDCGHGVNFKKVFTTGECYVCEFKKRYLKSE